MGVLLLVLLPLLLAGGCATQSENTQLANVAKDWSRVIRASQVIPVYPLTEDLQPGDIFLVQVSVDEQHEEYNKRGFLPLDNLITRVNPRGYLEFYERSFGVGAKTNPLPKHWLNPPDPGKGWTSAPNASFPTYSFSVRSGGGFNIALPVQGVPIGLNLLGGEAGDGTITIADARTYGVDTTSLYQDVRKWAIKNSDFLSNFGTEENRQNYLRVVSRVYLAGRLNISLHSSKSFAGSASGGAPRPVDLIFPSAGAEPTKVTLDSYKEGLTKLNLMIDESLGKQVGPNGLNPLVPGGTVKVVSASARSVSLVETFDRPLVIGYLGFDMAIGPGGTLGPPIPTHAVLTEKRTPPQTTPGIELLKTAALRRSYEILRQRKEGDPNAQLLIDKLDKAATIVPKKYPCNIFGFEGPEEPVIIHQQGSDVNIDASGFSSVTTYQGKLLSSIEDLQEARRGAKTIIKAKLQGGGDPVELNVEEQLRWNQKALDDLHAKLEKYLPELRQMVSLSHR
jgi:hypothetical protein